MGLLSALRERKAQRQTRLEIEREALVEYHALLYPPQAVDVPFTGRLIHMEDGSRYEGHNYTMTSAEQEGMLRGHVRDTPAPVVGDRLAWTAKGGQRMGVIVYVRDAQHLGPGTSEVAVRTIWRSEEDS